TVIDGLSQGYHSFEVYTMDNEGNRSISVYVSGMVYGENYEKSLSNRSVESFKYEIGGSSLVNWLVADSSSIGLKLRFKKVNDEEITLIVKNEDSISSLIDHDISSQISYQTMYKPNSLSIDTFYAPTQNLKVNEILLPNSGNPFIGINVSGRWGNLKDWNTNQAAKNHNGIGGFDNLN